MREVNMAHFELVLKGEDVSHFWPLKTKAELKHLEKEEKYCTWLQRRGGGVDDQIPCLRLQNRYFLMSLRVQKVVFRHVRLGPSFRNLEYTITGRPKLWIPLTLLREKLRTASRSLVECKERQAPVDRMALLDREHPLGQGSLGPPAPSSRKRSLKCPATLPPATQRQSSITESLPLRGDSSPGCCNGTSKRKRTLAAKRVPSSQSDFEGAGDGKREGLNTRDFFERGGASDTLDSIELQRVIPGGSSERFGTEWIGEFSRIFAVEEPFIPSKTTSGNDESYEHLVAATRHDFVADGSESPLSFDLDPGLFMQGIVHIVLKDFPSLGADPAELKAMFAKAVDHVLC